MILCFTGGEDSTTRESRFAAQLSRYVARKMSALAGRFERSASGMRNSNSHLHEVVVIKYFTIHLFRVHTHSLGLRTHCSHSSESRLISRALISNGGVLMFDLELSLSSDLFGVCSHMSRLPAHVKSLPCHCSVDRPAILLQHRLHAFPDLIHESNQA